ncbi:MAG: TetR/AcrR family transcriptional regulator [Candidatus Marinimicrobia bacterium]|nr:TetR/AcrR family transcriptional regulator [Candidatus Neomarinimicrobiota bacterium]
MSPRTENQFEAMRMKSRENIISVAMNLFAANGYHTSSIAQIAKSANISKGLIYNYFASKEELLDAIIKTGFAEIDQMLPPVIESENPRATMVSEIETVFQNYQSNFEFWKFYFQIIMQPKIFEIYAQPLKTFLSEQIVKLSDLFKSICVSHPELKARTLAALLDGIGFHMIIDEDYPLDDVKNFIIHNLIQEEQK